MLFRSIQLGFGCASVEEFEAGIKGVVVVEAETKSRCEGSTLQKKAGGRRVGICWRKEWCGSKVEQAEKKKRRRELVFGTVE